MSVPRALAGLLVVSVGIALVAAAQSARPELLRSVAVPLCILGALIVFGAERRIRDGCTARVLRVSTWTMLAVTLGGAATVWL